MKPRIAIVLTETADRVAKIMSEQFSEDFQVVESSVGGEYRAIVLPDDVKISRATYNEYNNFAHGASAAFFSGL